MITFPGWKLSRRRRIQPKVSAYQEWPQKQNSKEILNRIRPFWTPSKDTSWGKDHDQDHLSHLTRIPNSKSSQWKGFKLKNEFNPASVSGLVPWHWSHPWWKQKEKCVKIKLDDGFYDNFGAQTCSCPLMPWCPSNKFQKKVWEQPKKRFSRFSLLKEPRVSFNFLSAALGASGVYFTCTHQHKTNSVANVGFGRLWRHGHEGHQWCQGLPESALDIHLWQI